MILFLELKLYLNEIITHLSMEELLTNPQCSESAKRLEQSIWRLKPSREVTEEIKNEFDNLFNSISDFERRRNQDLNQAILLVRHRIDNLV